MSKRLWFQLHRWCGLGLAVFLLLQAISGAALIYHRPMAQLVDPDGMVRHSNGADLSLGDLLATVQASMPGYDVRRIVFPRAADETYFLYLADRAGGERYASVDPGSGAVLREGGPWAFPLHALMLLHYTLMAGDAGLGFLTALGLAALALVISALVYWWPRGGWRRSLRIDTRLSGRLVLRQAHRTLGVVIAVVIAASFATGMLRAGQLLWLSAPVAPPPVPLRPADFEAALTLARAEFPVLAARDVRLGGQGVVSVNFLTAETNSLAVHAVRIDAASRTRVALVRAEEGRNPGAFLVPIHTAERFGSLGKLVLLLAGIGLGMLCVTGPLMWLQARRRRMPSA